MTRLLQTRWVIGALMLVASMAGCGGDIFAPPDDKVTVLNATQDTVAFSIWDLEDSYLIDPNPFPPSRSAFNGRILSPGASQRVPVSDITAYRRDADLLVLAWRVRGDTIRGLTSVRWTRAEQRRSWYRVAIETPMVTY